MMRSRLAFLARMLFAATLLALVVLSSDARAQQGAAPTSPQTLPQRGANYAWDKSMLRGAFSYRDVIDNAMATKMSSGVAMVIAMRAYVFEDGTNSLVALSIRTCRIAFDLWDEVYRIRIASSAGQRQSAAVNVEGVLRQCAEVRDQPLVDRSLLQPNKSYYLGVLVEVNPVSEEMLNQMHNWVSRPGGNTSIGPGDALFGSFAGLFVRTIGNADRTARFKTPLFSLPPPAPPNP